MTITPVVGVIEKLSIAKPASLPASLESTQRIQISAPGGKLSPLISPLIAIALELPSKEPLVATGKPPT